MSISDLNLKTLLHACFTLIFAASCIVVAASLCSSGIYKQLADRCSGGPMDLIHSGPDSLEGYLAEH